MILGTESVGAGCVRLVALGKIEPFLGDEGEDEVVADRGHLVEPGFAQFAFDVVFGGETEPTVRVESGVTGCP